MPRPAKARTDLVCPDCGASMVIKRSRYGWFYGCVGYPQCKGTHGAHPDGAPLGRPAGRRVKDARIKAHNAFDQLWQQADLLECYDPKDDKARQRIRRAARNRAYKWLSEQMNVEQVHIGAMGEEDCYHVQVLSMTINAAGIRAWHKRKQQELQR